MVGHIYETEFLDIPIEDMRVLGESMMRRGRSGRDADLSFGVLPPLRWLEKLEPSHVPVVQYGMGSEILTVLYIHFQIFTI